ncbi:unnamed protein product [Eruca vesicaria subsp. sativa]|uniref:Protein kinase domain-containing protein n=1 Tax=Eruca vesicaria subsp. sativa TaxID=29727 RepID=A0ABC8J2Y0_ERUVS|nr:unnamed protein product [Eruca vesicaria subsp. sativa]
MAARLHSTRVLGTFGYHAPDFAVVLLELLTGRKPVDHTLPRRQQSLVTWVMFSAVFSASDSGLLLINQMPYDDDQLAAVAALCVQYEENFRLNMSIVVKARQPLLNPSRYTPHSNPH